MTVLKTLKIGVIWLVTAVAVLVGVVALAIGGTIPVALLSGFNAGVSGLSAERLVYADVRLIAMDGDGAREHQWVVVEDGLITNVMDMAPSAQPGDVVIDGRGRTLLPGLIDMHVHVFDRTDNLLYLSYGVTTVRNMMGMPMHLRMRSDLDAGAYPGPRLITAAPTLNEGEWAPFHSFVDVTNAAETVSRYADRGYDFIKVYDGLQAETFAAVVDAAEIEGLPVSGHPTYALSLDAFLSSGVDTLEHVEELYSRPLERMVDEDLLGPVVEQIAASGVYVTPTLKAYHNLFQANADPDDFFASVSYEYLNPMIEFFGHRMTADIVDYPRPDLVARKFGYMQTIAAALYEGGVPVLLGTDTGPSLTVAGMTTHEEIALLQEARVSSMDILSSGTIVAARALGLQDEIGQIQVGMRAELVLVEGDPLVEMSVLAEPAGVMMRGQWYDREALLALRERAMRTTSLYATIGWMLWHTLTM